MESQTVQLSAAAQDVGSAQETLACQGEGENVEIAFNYAYVLDGLGSVNTDDVFLEVQSGMKPGIFKAGRRRELPVPGHACAHLLTTKALHEPSHQRRFVR